MNIFHRINSVEKKINHIIKALIFLLIFFCSSAYATFSDADLNAPWFEKSIPELQALMSSGKLTSEELTRAYLMRIELLNPRFNAVIEINPDALAIAKQLDEERKNNHIRGPLHGIPILVKDNIDTYDKMQTTAGSFALMGSIVPKDATLISKLREAGAVILGKSNLSEWSNFRSFYSFNGWSARGGFTNSPYLPFLDPSGSSTGSAVAAATNMSAAAIGTETAGSIVHPAGLNLVVGLKPTIGLISQDGIIPISHNFDTAGPIARTVTDAAILLNVMQSPDSSRLTPQAIASLPKDYTANLSKYVKSKKVDLQGLRIGVDISMFYIDLSSGGFDDSTVKAAVETLKKYNAKIIELPLEESPFHGEMYTHLIEILLNDFKLDIANYLSRLSFEPGIIAKRSLSDLIKYNNLHCPHEMKYFGQDIFEISETYSGNLEDPNYKNAMAKCLEFSKDRIKYVMEKYQLDVILSPSSSPGFASAVCPGYPVISVPIGLTEAGIPAGFQLYSGHLQEEKLLQIAYAVEQVFKTRASTNPPLQDPIPFDPQINICTKSASPAVPPGILKSKIRIL